MAKLSRIKSRGGQKVIYTKLLNALESLKVYQCLNTSYYDIIRRDVEGYNPAKTSSKDDVICQVCRVIGSKGTMFKTSCDNWVCNMCLYSSKVKLVIE